MRSLFRRLFPSHATPTDPARSSDSFSLLSRAGHVKLSPLTDDDRGLLESWFHDSHSCRLAFGVDTDAETLSGMTEQYLQELREDASGILMISSTASLSAPLGFLRYKLFRQSRRSMARVGILLGDPQYRGKGLGTEAMLTLLDYLFEQRAVDLVELDTAHFNIMAQSCFEKCGFRVVRETEVIGLHNRWTERRLVMRLPREQWEQQAVTRATCKAAVRGVSATLAESTDPP